MVDAWNPMESEEEKKENAGRALEMRRWACEMRLLRHDNSIDAQRQQLRVPSETPQAETSARFPCHCIDGAGLILGLDWAPDPDSRTRFRRWTASRCRLGTRRDNKTDSPTFSGRGQRFPMRFNWISIVLRLFPDGNSRPEL